MIRLFKNTKKMQNKKFDKLPGVSCESVSLDPDKVIYNFSSHKLTEVEKSVLSKDLQFALPPERLDYAGYMLLFELLSPDIKTNNLTKSQSSSTKSKLLDTTFTSYSFFERKKGSC